MEKQMYNTFETATALGVKTRTVRGWIHDGKIKAVKYNGGKKWFIGAEEIERIAKGEPSK